MTSDHDPIPAGLRPPPDDPAALAAALRRFGETAAAEADVAYALLDSPVGTLLAARTPRGLVRLAYTDFPGGIDAILDDLAARVSPRVVEARGHLDDLVRELDEYFAGRRRAFDVPLDWSLVGDFGRRVLAATAEIPFGGTATYGEVAARAGAPGGARATGGALGGNPFPIVVPCHRVLAAGGRLGGYTGGTDRKERLLAVEGVLPGRLA